MYDKLTLFCMYYVFWIFQKSNCLSSSAAKIVDTNDIPHNFSQLSVRVISTFNSFHVVFFFEKCNRIIVRNKNKIRKSCVLV